MLVIRKEQMDALKQAPLGAFKEQMLYHLGENFPIIYQIIGQEQMRKVIDLGVYKAQGHDFKTKGDIYDYLALMFTHGSYFDEDPMLPWAKELLQKVEIKLSVKMDNLYAKSKEYLQTCVGQEREYYKKAVNILKRKPFESIKEYNTGDFNNDINSFLAYLYPERYKISKIEKLIVIGKTLTEKYSIITQHGHLCYIGLMFILGSYFNRDPLHPWASAILHDNSLMQNDLKIKQLYEAAIALLNRSINTH